MVGLKRQDCFQNSFLKTHTSSKSSGGGCGLLRKKKDKMMRLKSTEKPLNRIITMSPTSTPYTTHKETPVEWIRNIEMDRSDTDPVRRMRTICGKKDTVVPVPARTPMVLVIMGDSIPSYSRARFLFFLKTTTTSKSSPAHAGNEPGWSPHGKKGVAPCREGNGISTFFVCRRACGLSYDRTGPMIGNGSAQ